MKKYKIDYSKLITRGTLLLLLIVTILADLQLKLLK